MVYTANLENSMPIPVEPGVLSVHVVNSNGTSDVPVYVPWKDCRLAYCYGVVTSTIDTSGGMALDLELDTAGGTTIASIDFSASDAIGTIAEGTFDSEVTGEDLDRSDATKDGINIEITGSATTGTATVFMYFEPEVNQ